MSRQTDSGQIGRCRRFGHRWRSGHDRRCVGRGSGTGASAGIGAHGERLARDGWRVIVADRDAAGSAPPGGRYAVCDVADETAVATLLAGVAAGEGRLDALVCNAGFMIRKPLAQLPSMSGRACWPPT